MRHTERISDADNPEPTWELIGTFSVVSKTYRTLAIETSFSQNHQRICFSWRTLMDARTTLHLKPPRSLLDLDPFLHLRTTRFDCPGPASIYRLPFIHTSIVTGLKLQGTIWPFSFAFRVNPQSGAACAIRAAAIVPMTLVYTDGLGLLINYARALSTLPHLHAVRVALPYSPRGTHISLDPTAPPDLNAELCAGECERCARRSRLPHPLHRAQAGRSPP
ncbi:hypothetical protein B0H14DRAFT_45622 [Mycena olivaceomarginata]|nr:hypothetical protein B0H14DRAFT_45622 [Mycena olivaceomarginata]